MIDVKIYDENGTLYFSNVCSSEDEVQAWIDDLMTKASTSWQACKNPNIIKTVLPEEV